MKLLQIKQAIKDEKREFPRIETSLPLEVNAKNLNSSLKIHGQALNLSTDGIGFLLERPLPEDSTIQVKLHADNPIELPVKITRVAISHNEELCGGFFAGPSKSQLLSLKEFLWLDDQYIVKHIDGLLSKIEQTRVRKRVLVFFVKEVRNYLRNFFELVRASKNSSNGNLQEAINILCDKVVCQGHEIEKLINDEEIVKEVKHHFRLMIGSWVYESKAMKISLEKPRGYAGDYRIIDTVYDNYCISKGIGAYFDNYFLNNPLARAVRNRKDKIASLIEGFLSNTNTPSVNILNIACGPCRELRELFAKPLVYKGRINIICVDQDDAALTFAKKSLTNVPSNVNIKFFKEDILNFCKNSRKYNVLLGNQDLVYSMGLAAYLPDLVLSRLIRFCWEVLSPNGNFIFAHKDIDADKFALLPPSWFCEWDFVPRNQEKLLKIIENSGIHNYSLSVDREFSQKILFLTLKRNMVKQNFYS